MAAARKAYFELIKSFPKSPHVPGAYFAFGEHFLEQSKADRSKLDVAREFFRKVQQFPPPKNSLYALASYRLAEIEKLRGDGAGALSQAKRTLEALHQYPSPLAERLRPLAQVAFAAAYVSVGQPARARSFVTAMRVDADERLALLVALIKALDAKGDRPAARRILTDLLANSSDRHVCKQVAALAARLNVSGCS